MSYAGSQRRGWRRVLVAGLLILIGLAGLMAWMLRPSKLAALPVPNPNGYDTLLAAGRLVTAMPPAKGVADKATDEELRAFLAANEKVLALAETGCSQESVVPLEKMASMEAHVEVSGPLRQLSRVLACQAVLARREGRTSEALEANRCLLHLAHAVSHGGLLADQLTGAAIQRQAIVELEGPLLPKLSPADARRLIADLERLGRDREPVTKIADRDLDFAISRQGLKMRVAYATNAKALNALRAPAIKSVESAERQSQGRIRFLLVKLALHAYALEHSEKPQPGDLEALVPSYLTEVPMAPGNERRLTLDDLPPETEAMQENPERP